MKLPQAAKSVRIGCCEHGTIYVELFDKGGKKFAVAAMDVATAAAFVVDAIKACEESLAGVGGECAGHA